MVSVLFSAIIAERSRELGLLKAIGARRAQIVGMLLMEAGLATAVGGVVGCMLGVLLMRGLRTLAGSPSRPHGHSVRLVRGRNIGLIALSCIALTALIGAAGALLSGMAREPARAL